MLEKAQSCEFTLENIATDNNNDGSTFQIDMIIRYQLWFQ